MDNKTLNQKLKRTKYAVIFFAKTRKKTAIKFSRLAKRYWSSLVFWLLSY